MNKENKEIIASKEKLLNFYYLKQAKRFRNDLKINLSDRQKREQIYLDFLDMLLEGQKNEKSVDEVIPDYNAFVNSCIESQAKNNVMVRQAVTYRKPLVVAGCVLLAICLVLLYIFASGYFGVWRRGIDYISRSDDYAYGYHILDEQISFEVSLAADASEQNEGKVIYVGNSCRIIIQSLSFTAMGDSEDNFVITSWRVKLLCVGISQYDFAQIVGGINYTNDIRTQKSAKATYTIAGVEYDGEVTMRPFSDFYNSCEMDIRIGLGNIIIIGGGGFSAEEQAIIDALQTLDSLSITLDGLVLNQWIRM